MARVRFSRGVRANIDKINTNKTATEGSLYFATDDGTLWYGTASGTLTQVRDNIDHNTTYTSLKNPYSLTLQGNGTTLANGTYDGSSAKTVNITPASIGASASGHKHDAGDITSGTLPVARGGTGQTNLNNVTVGTARTIAYTGGRPASANQDPGRGKIAYYLATSAMTEGKPSEDGQIIHMSWDGGSWDSQIVQNHSDGGLQVRARNSGTWSKWVRVYDENHKPSASDVTGLGNLATKSTNGSTANFLRGDGTWVTPSYPSVSNATITIKQTGKSDQTFTLNGGATTISLNDNNTWTALKGATTSAAGTAGYAPAPSAGAANRYLRSDGTWSVPPDTDTHKTWGLSISGHTVSIVDGGTNKSVTVPDDNTTALTSMTGTLGLDHGGTGATTAAGARANIGAVSSDVITISSTEPTSSECKLWIKI